MFGYKGESEDDVQNDENDQDRNADWIKGKQFGKVDQHNAKKYSDEILHDGNAPHQQFVSQKFGGIQTHADDRGAEEGILQDISFQYLEKMDKMLDQSDAAGFKMSQLDDVTIVMVKSGDASKDLVPRIDCGFREKQTQKVPFSTEESKSLLHGIILAYSIAFSSLPNFE